MRGGHPPKWLCAPGQDPPGIRPGRACGTKSMQEPPPSSNIHFRSDCSCPSFGIKQDKAQGLKSRFLCLSSLLLAEDVRCRSTVGNSIRSAPVGSNKGLCWSWLTIQGDTWSLLQQTLTTGLTPLSWSGMKKRVTCYFLGPSTPEMLEKGFDAVEEPPLRKECRKPGSYL